MSAVGEQLEGLFATGISQGIAPPLEFLEGLDASPSPPRRTVAFRGTHVKTFEVDEADWPRCRGTYNCAGAPEHAALSPASCPAASPSPPTLCQGQGRAPPGRELLGRCREARRRVARGVRALTAALKGASARVRERARCVEARVPTSPRPVETPDCTRAHCPVRVCEQGLTMGFMLRTTRIANCVACFVRPLAWAPVYRHAAAAVGTVAEWRSKAWLHGHDEIVAVQTHALLARMELEEQKYMWQMATEDHKAMRHLLNWRIRRLQRTLQLYQLHFEELVGQVLKSAQGARLTHVRISAVLGSAE